MRRGVTLNPPSRHAEQHSKPCDDGWYQEPPPLRTRVDPDASRTFLSWSDSPDLPFDPTCSGGLARADSSAYSDRRARAGGEAKMTATYVGSLRAAGALLAVAVLAGGCSWVRLEPSAAEVVVGRADQVQQCRRKGQVTVRTTDSVAGVSRGAGTVSEELERLARNAAVGAGADTVVPLDKPWWGEQKFDMYRCRP